MLEHYLDASVGIYPINLVTGERELGGLEKSLVSVAQQPITRYVQTLRDLRKLSQTTSGHRDEINFGVTFKERLQGLGAELQLPDEHFSINTTGAPLIVKEQTGEHLIAPTHFENGAYFSHPHADHQLGYSAYQLPSIKIGQYVRFGRNSAVNAGGDVDIGDGVWLSPGSQLLRQDHDPFGRPSIGSRTVAMTSLPPVKLCDYAWVGREAIVGWNADYLGKASIVGIRTFVNTWVGDYSIVGDHGKVLQYLPFKAYLLETYQPTIEQALQVSDWAAVNADWLTVYRDECTPESTDVLPEEITKLLKVNGGKKLVLLIDPTDNAQLQAVSSQAIDVIAGSRLRFANHLQWAQDQGHQHVRVRAGLDFSALPFPSAGEFHYRRKLGYSLVITNSAPSEHQARQVFVSELARVLAAGAYLLYPHHSAGENADELFQSAFVLCRDVALNGEQFILLKKR
jgi:acetyltransferase-like isoleucine patch superfamily enzyme